MIFSLKSTTRASKSSATTAATDILTALARSEGLSGNGFMRDVELRI